MRRQQFFSKILNTTKQVKQRLNDGQKLNDCAVMLFFSISKWVCLRNVGNIEYHYISFFLYHF